MAKKKGLMSEQDRERVLEQIQQFFEEERGESLGVIAAGNIYDFFYDTLGKDLCKKALDLYRDRLNLKLEDGEAEVLGVL